MLYEVITLIPPSIMLIVYSATSTVSVVKLYAGAIFPGFMLAGLYMLYVIGRAILNPSLAPKPRPEEIPVKRQYIDIRYTKGAIS